MHQHVKAALAMSIGMGLAVAAPIAAASSAQALPAIMISKVQFDSPGADRGGNTSLNAEYVVIKNTTRSSALAHRLDAARQDRLHVPVPDVHPQGRRERHDPHRQGQRDPDQPLLQQELVRLEQHRRHRLPQERLGHHRRHVRLQGQQQRLRLLLTQSTAR